MIEDGTLLGKVIQSAVDIAKYIRYESLGTFEFLVSPSAHEFYFMEINPRLQVEHTVTEACCGIDLVQLQLLIASGRTIDDLHLTLLPAGQSPPVSSAIQLRVTAEDVRHNFSLSVGRINEVSLPRGNGVRVDTHIEPGTIVSTDFDSLLAKIIVAGSGFRNAVQKGHRALQDLVVGGITTNSELLEGILLAQDFLDGSCDTQWLEENLKNCIEAGSRRKSPLRAPAALRQYPIASSASSGGSLSLKKGDSWNLSYSGREESKQHELFVKIEKIHRNDFPNEFEAQLSLRAMKDQASAEIYNLKLHQSESTSAADNNNHCRGDPRDPTHLICPLSGQLVEMLVEEGDEVGESDAVAVIRQMKMELEVRAHRRGVIQKIWEVEDGEDISAGVLICEIRDSGEVKPKL